MGTRAVSTGQNETETEADGYTDEDGRKRVLDDLGRGFARVLVPFTLETGPLLPSMRAVREVFERTYLEAILLRSAGNVSKAARLAGRNRTDLYDLLRRHQLGREKFK